MQLNQNSDSLSKACRNNSWSAWMSCRLGFLAAAIAAEDDWYNPLAFPPEPKPIGWLPPEELCFCGAIAPQKWLKKNLSHSQMWSVVKKEKKKRKKLGSSSFVKTKEQRLQQTSRLGGALLTVHFKSRVWKFQSSVFDIGETTIQCFRSGLGFTVREVGERAWNARNEIAASGKLTRLAS